MAVKVCLCRVEGLVALVNNQVTKQTQSGLSLSERQKPRWSRTGVRLATQQYKNGLGTQPVNNGKREMQTNFLMVVIVGDDLLY